MGIHDFSKAPRSLTEARADRTESAADWTARDVLVRLLRQIDSGEFNPEELVVIMRQPVPLEERLHANDEQEKETIYTCSTPNTMTLLGMLEHAKWLIVSE